MNEGRQKLLLLATAQSVLADNEKITDPIALTGAGMLTGLVLAMRHPEYARALFESIGEEAEANPPVFWLVDEFVEQQPIEVTA